MEKTEVMIMEYQMFKIYFDTEKEMFWAFTDLNGTKRMWSKLHDLKNYLDKIVHQMRLFNATDFEIRDQKFKKINVYSYHEENFFARDDDGNEYSIDKSKFRNIIVKDDSLENLKFKEKLLENDKQIEEYSKKSKELLRDNLHIYSQMSKKDLNYFKTHCSDF